MSTRSVASRAWNERDGAREMALDETVRLIPARKGLGLYVRRGCLLVTQEGDLQDHVLEASDELRLTGPGVVVAWALSPSNLIVVHDAEAPVRPASLSASASVKRAAPTRA
jgi:Protein of unknown function (DUF2917)